jgi:signal transduction histidine kinase
MAMFSVNIVFSETFKFEQESKQFEAEETAKRKDQLKNYVDIAYRTLEANYQKAANGEIPLSAAKRTAKEEIKNIRYDNGTGYIWINDTGAPVPRMIMHPTLPDLDGTVLDDEKNNCAYGTDKNLFRAFIELCSSDGEGFVDYLWPKPTEDGLTVDQPKISYVKGFTPWQWVIGTGVYTDDIRASLIVKENVMKQSLNRTLLFTGVLFIIGLSIGFALTFWIASSSMKPLGGEPFEIRDLAVSVSKGNLISGFNGNRKKEYGAFRALRTMAGKLRDVID